MPSRKRRRRYDEEPESILAMLAEALAGGIVQAFTSQAQKLGEAVFVARQGTNVPPAAGDSEAEPEPVVDNATTEKPADSKVIEGEWKYVD